ncbi:hypothetical protein FSP39_024032 [Pinctada imbricata]|uniref:MRG-binding protein n=1 Tax=Pinctada imbricata TaxID=66713 RepID=A0AA89BY70_PINIB|nr:hypothetical protein FSP39_024032 [Pinctada imbricata]
MITKMEKGNWPVEAEVNLFHAMRGRKPAGVNRHFQMMCIHDRLNSSALRKISSQDIWDHLSSMYDLQALNESEIIPFPNKENDFLLPEEEFQEFTTKSYPRVTEIKADGEEKSSKSDTSGSKTAKSEKTEVKQPENKVITSVSASTPDNSSKRKRTRNTPSEKASPATPDNPPSKRRR